MTSRLSSNAGSQIVIVGAGPVGLAFALGVQRLRGCNVTMVEKQTLASTRRSEDNLPLDADQLDTRVYALSPGSRKFLESLGVWQQIPQERVTDVRAMQVWGDDEVTHPQIKFEESTAVAHIVEHSMLMRALVDTLHASNTIRVIDGVNIAAISAATTSRKITLSNGTELNADLVIGADGARSVVREFAGIPAKTFDYKSDGIVANFKTEQAHGNIARQWFHGDSILAYLPLPNQHISIVWSVTKTRADELLALSSDAFADEVAAAGGYALGALTCVSATARVSLHRLIAHDWVQPGLALIGDAAHAIHPMAGQGANLGIADAHALIDALQNRSALSAVGDMRVLREYERARREDAATMGAITHGLRDLYLSDSTLAKRARNQGLSVLNRLPIIKSLVMSHAMK